MTIKRSIKAETYIGHFDAMESTDDVTKIKIKIK